MSAPTFAFNHQPRGYCTIQSHGVKVGLCFVPDREVLLEAHGVIPVRSIGAGPRKGCPAVRRGHEPICRCKACPFGCDNDSHHTVGCAAGLDVVRLRDQLGRQCGDECQGSLLSLNGHTLYAAMYCCIAFSVWTMVPFFKSVIDWNVRCFTWVRGLFV